MGNLRFIREILRLLFKTANIGEYEEEWRVENGCRHFRVSITLSEKATWTVWCLRDWIDDVEARDPVVRKSIDFRTTMERMRLVAHRRFFKTRSTHNFLEIL